MKQWNRTYQFHNNFTSEHQLVHQTQSIQQKLMNSLSAQVRLVSTSKIPEILGLFSPLT